MMAFLPVSGRVPFSLSTQLVIDNISARQRDLNKTALELSSGRKLNAPSDSPNEAIRASILQKAREQAKQYQSNIEQADHALTFTDDMLRSFADALDTARSIAVSVNNSTASTAEIDGARIQIDAIIDQLISEGNRKYLERYVFSKADGQTPPFVREGNRIRFNGDTAEFATLQGLNEPLGMSVTADSSIGVFSSAGYGTALTPNVNGSTRLSELNGGSGIARGSILVDTGVGSPVAVDLSTAADLQDVIDLVNNDPTLSGQGVVLALNASGNGLAVTAAPGATITIREVGGNSTARDLGLALNGASVPAQGANVRAAVTLTTPLSLLNGGAGVDTSNPLVIENGTYSASVDLSAAVTVEDALNLINGAGVRVRAQINANGTGINVLNTLSGSSFSIHESSQTATTARDLGIQTTRLDTPLADFNEQAGVDLREGPDLTITVRSGAAYQIDLSGTQTISDVKSRIESATAGDVTLDLNPQGGIRLTDNTAGAGAFAVANIDDSQAATDLGIAANVGSAGTILGQNVHKSRVQGIFDTLLRLADGLRTHDLGEVGMAAQQMARNQDKLFAAQGGLGARLETISTIHDRLATELEQLELETTQLVDADLSETTVKLALQQTALQAALASGGRLLQGSLLDYI